MHFKERSISPGNLANASALSYVQRSEREAKCSHLEPRLKSGAVPPSTPFLQLYAFITCVGQVYFCLNAACYMFDLLQH